MYGAPGVSQLFALIPMAGLSAPSRFGLLTIFSVVAMASIGLSAMCESDRARRPGTGRDRAMRAALAGLAIMTALVGALIWWQWPAFRQAAFVREMALATLWSGAIACGAAAIVVGWAKGVVTPRIAVALLIVVSVGDLFAVGFRFHPMLPRAQVFPPLPSIDAIKADPGAVSRGRLRRQPAAEHGHGLRAERSARLRWRGAAALHRPARPGVRSGHGAPDRSARRACRSWICSTSSTSSGTASTARPFPTGCRSTTAPVAVYRNDRVFPRAWLVDRAVVRDDASTLDWIVAATSDLRHEAPIAGGAERRLSPEPSASGGAGEVAISRYEPTEVELTTRASGRRLLVLADAWYPGWEVYVDGRKAAIVRAYYALRAVPVPGGQHVVRFSYEPASLRIGMAVSAAALIALSALVIVAARRRRPPGGVLVAPSRRSAACIVALPLAISSKVLPPPLPTAVMSAPAATSRSATAG